MRLLAGLLLVATVPGCFSSSSVSDAGPSIPLDAAGGSQPVGSPCDPRASSPCVSSDPCLGVYCDPTTQTCTEYVAEAGGTCSSGTAPCTVTSDCQLGLTCGFPIGSGCGASGVCINLALDCQDDAASCSAGGGTACGCSGAPVAVVIPGYAAGPTPAAASTGATCAPDGGSAGSSDAGDAGDAGG
jgi:hypothetical protein